MRHLLVIAATEAELCGQPGLVCGVGPVEAALETARVLAVHPPDAALHVGLAGGRGLVPGTLVIGSEARYADLAAHIPVTSEVEPDPALLDAARATLPEARVLPIATSASVGGTASVGAAVEAMEGFAVLRACALAGVPAVEVRAVSNELGEEDRSRWQIEVALEALADALARLRGALGQE
jgi:predicted 5'-methylthioadenosine/S-adenosylhomocysteine nucleosidase